MNMPFGNIGNLIQGYQQFMSQKEQFLSQIPKEMGSNPNQIIQNLMNSGRPYYSYDDEYSMARRNAYGRNTRNERSNRMMGYDRGGRYSRADEKEKLMEKMDEIQRKIETM